MGPPVTSKYHSEQFKNIYASTHRIFIDDGRYAVEVERRYTDVVSLLKNELMSCSLGKDVSESIASGYEVLRNEEIRFVAGIGYFFRSYFRGI
jgi:tRNA nucleotidyltransferase (CCA-adding enzyme)